MKRKKIGRALLSAALVTALVGGVVATPVTASAVSKPAKVKISSVKSSSVGNLTVKWKKAKRAKKYQVRIGTNKACTKNKKTATLSSKKRAKTFSSLKHGKKYYVKVRAYTTYKKKGKKKTYKKYGSWSKVKSVTVKKASTSTKKPTTSPSKPTKPTNPSNPSNPTNPGSGNNPGSGEDIDKIPWDYEITADYNDQVAADLEYYGMYEKVKEQRNFLSKSECLENGGHFYIPTAVTGEDKYTTTVTGGVMVCGSTEGKPILSSNLNVILNQLSPNVKYRDVNSKILSLFKKGGTYGALSQVAKFNVVCEGGSYDTTEQCVICGDRHTVNYDRGDCNHKNWNTAVANNYEMKYNKYCLDCGVYFDK